MEQVKTKEFLKIDPRVKLVFILAAGGIIIGNIPFWAELLILGAALALSINEKMYMTALKFLIAFMVLYAVEQAVRATGKATGINMFLLLISSVFRRFVPAFLCGKVFVNTTTISEIMASSAKMNIPYKYVIPLAVVVRFFPTLKEEWDNVSMAMKMRGIGFSLEYILVPLLSSSSRIGEELSAAALSRGLGSVEKRTNLCAVSLKAHDYILLVLLVVFGVVTYGNLL